MTTARAEFAPAPLGASTLALRCECRRWRQGLLGDHRDWLAEYRRTLLAGRGTDEQAFAKVGQP
jgi:hypothetical protein